MTARDGQLAVIGHANDAPRINRIFHHITDTVIRGSTLGKNHPDVKLRARRKNIVAPVKNNGHTIDSPALRPVFPDKMDQPGTPVLKRLTRGRSTPGQAVHHIVPVDQELS